jgi:predicted MFS family arabinose efflux permease
MFSSPYVALAILTAINAANFIDRYVAVALTPLLAQHFHLSNLEIGYLATAFFFIYTIAAPVLGVLGDRIPRKYIIALAVGIWSAATAAGSYCETFASLLMVRAVVGIGEAGYGAAAPAWIADLFSREKRGLMIGVFEVALPVGTAIGYALGGWVGEHYGWRRAFQFVGIPGVLLATAMLFLKEPARGAQDGGATKRPTWADYRALLRNRTFLVICAGMATMTFMMSGLAAFAPKFLTEVRHLPMAQAGLWFGVVTATAGILGTLAGGVLSTRLAKGRTVGQLMIAAAGLLAGAPLAALAIQAKSPPVFFGVLFVAELCLFLNIGPLNACIANVVPSQVRAAAYSMNILSIHVLGDTPAPLVIGKVADLTSLTTAMTLTTGFAALAGLILLAGARGARHQEPAVQVAPAI